MALGCHRCCRLQPRSLASVWPLVTTWDRNINTDSGCGRTRDRHGPRCHHGPRRQRKLPGSTWPGSSMAVKRQHDPRCQPHPQHQQGLRWPHRHWLWWGHRSRHGPHLQRWSGQYHGPSSQPRSDPPGPSWGTTLRHQNSNRFRPQVSVWPLVASIAGPWTQTWSWQQPQSGCQHGPRGLYRPPRLACTPGQQSSDIQHSSRTSLWPQVVPTPQAPAQPPMMTKATDIHTGPLDCSRTGDQDLALGHSPGLGISLDLGKPTGPSHQAVPHHPCLSGSASLPSPRATVPGIHSDLKPL